MKLVGIAVYDPKLVMHGYHVELQNYLSENVYN